MSLSPDGKTASLFDGNLDAGLGMNLGKSYVFDVVGDTYACIDEPKNFQVTQLFNDGTVLGYAEEGPATYIGYIRLPENDSFVTLYDWVDAGAPDTSLWMEDNMTHSVRVLGESGFDVIETVVTGAPYADSDLTVMATRAVNMWETSGPDMFRPLSCVLDLQGYSGIDEVQCDGDIADDNDMKVDIYTIDGRLVVSHASPAFVRTLANGIYILHGGDVTRKIAVNNR